MTLHKERQSSRQEEVEVDQCCPLVMLKQVNKFNLTHMFVIVTITIEIL